MSQQPRRSFLTRLNAGAAAIAAVTLGSRALAQSTAAPKSPFVPARHEQDDWLDSIPGQHRLIFDTVSNEAFGEALLFGNNFLTANRNSYGLKNSDLAVVIIARHLSTALGFNDAMWAKYGAQMVGTAGITLAAGAAAPKTNPRNTGGFGVDALARQGVHFAICAMATGRVAGAIAQATGTPVADITAELIANLVPNGHMVPAGIVAVNRAQERGYSLVTA
jgi:intracellular sulfur oxidation DsrE/DsrF family protein